MKRIKSLAIVGLLTVAGAVAAHAQVLNGNFTANAAGYTDGAGYNGGANPASIASWTGFDGVVYDFSESNIGLNGAVTSVGNPFAPTNPGGVTYAFVQGGGRVIFQNISLALNTTYTLDIYVAGRASGVGHDLTPALFSVEFADANTPFTPFWNNAGYGNLPGNQDAFDHFNLNFTTPVSGLGNGVLIELWNRSGAGDNTVDFANVSVTAVPEPTAAALAGIGIVMAGAGRLARRRNA